jgi:hypothetical protein
MAKDGIAMPVAITIVERVAFVINLIILDSNVIDVILGMDWLSNNKGTHKLCQEVYQAYHPGYEGIEYIAEPVVTIKGATNHVELNQLDTS